MLTFAPTSTGLSIAAFASPETKERTRKSPADAKSSDHPHSDTLLGLVRNHHQAIFHLTHALLRDEIAAEKITQQVFARARRRIHNGAYPQSLVPWLYYSSLRFARAFYWRVSRAAARRRASCPAQFEAGAALDLKTFVEAIALHPGKIDARDCELVALRHALGLSLPTIAQLLRMHPYEVSNRLVWARERVLKLTGRNQFTHGSTAADSPKDIPLAMSA